MSTTVTMCELRDHKSLYNEIKKQPMLELRNTQLVFFLEIHI